jgi:hypothetical protein
MANKNKPAERYLKIPNHILNLEKIGHSEKLLLAHIYSFGGRGCYQSNSTLAEIFMVSAHTISRRVRGIKDYIYIKNPKGYYRTMWAKSHPDVQLAVKEFGKYAEHHKQKRRGELAKSAIGVGRNCVTTNNNTIKETKKNTTATPSPMPAGGQATALLEDRKAGKTAAIENFKKNFGIGRKPYKQMPEKEFNERKNKQLADLAAFSRLKRTRAKRKLSGEGAHSQKQQ